MMVNERRTVVGGGLIGHCVPPTNRGERSTPLVTSVYAQLIYTGYNRFRFLINLLLAVK